MERKSSKAFTLIELLIVVLIIAILAAIAIPNFLEFQTRAKVSRIKNDMRTVATALEAYCVDEGTYVGPRLSYVPFGFYRGYYALTSPIAYMTSVPRDPFGESKVMSGQTYLESYEFGTAKEGSHTNYGGYNWSASGGDEYGDFYPNDCWLMSSVGPDGLHDGYASSGGTMSNDFCTVWYPWPGVAADSDILRMVYNPTNGTVSFGQINRAGGAPISRPPVNIYLQVISR